MMELKRKEINGWREMLRTRLQRRPPNGLVTALTLRLATPVTALPIEARESPCGSFTSS